MASQMASIASSLLMVVTILSVFRGLHTIIHVSRKSSANVMMAIFIATEINNIVMSLIMFAPFLSLPLY